MSLPSDAQTLTNDVQLEPSLIRRHQIIKRTRYRRILVLEFADGTKLAFGRKIPCWTGPDWVVLKTQMHGYWIFEETDQTGSLQLGRAQENSNLETSSITPTENDILLLHESFSDCEALPLDTALDIFLSRELSTVDISTTDRRQQTEASQPILRLSTEIVCLIMNLLWYQDLNSLSSTCRRFRAISRDRIFDSSFFRSRTPKTLAADDEADSVEVHPVLTNMDPWYSEISQIRYWAARGTWSCKNIEEASCWTQMATNPPLTTIKFQLGDCPLWTIEALDGVTVKHLLTEMMCYMGLMQQFLHNTIWSFENEEGQISTAPVSGHRSYHAWVGFPRKLRDPINGHLILCTDLEAVPFMK